MLRFFACLVVVVLLLVATVSEARTVHRCLRDGSVSLSTAPEPGSRCTALEIDDASARQPNPWGAVGLVRGKLYRREQDGRTVYGTRELPGSIEVLAFTVKTPAGAPAQRGVGRLGPPRLEVFSEQFRATAKATGVEESWLRAIAHAESGFDRFALSPKGAQGLMQLMPATAARYGVEDPFASEQSIRAGGEHLKDLIDRYDGDLTRVAAAYNAGVGALARYGGVPPYAETRDYVAKVLTLHQRYRDALAARELPVRQRATSN
jgi:hypothetical protein